MLDGPEDGGGEQCADGNRHEVRRLLGNFFGDTIARLLFFFLLLLFFDLFFFRHLFLFHGWLHAGASAHELGEVGHAPVRVDAERGRIDEQLLDRRTRRRRERGKRNGPERGRQHHPAYIEPQHLQLLFVPDEIGVALQETVGIGRLDFADVYPVRTAQDGQVQNAVVVGRARRERKRRDDGGIERPERQSVGAAVPAFLGEP